MNDEKFFKGYNKYEAIILIGVLLIGFKASIQILRMIFQNAWKR
jgi:hypothetical protein